MCMHTCGGHRLIFTVFPQELFKERASYCMQSLIYLPSSRTISLCHSGQAFKWVLGSNSGPHACKASTLLINLSSQPKTLTILALMYSSLHNWKIHNVVALPTFWLRFGMDSTMLPCVDWEMGFFFFTSSSLNHLYSRVLWRAAAQGRITAQEFYQSRIVFPPSHTHTRLLYIAGQIT